MAQEVKRTITIETKKSENKLREFRKEMTRLRGELTQLDDGTEEYSRTVTELANKQQKLNDIQEDIRTSMQDLGARINNLNRVARGAVGGFAAIQGAIGLFGASSDKLDPMINKLTSLITIIEGLEQVEGLTKSIPQLVNSFKGFGDEIANWFSGIFNGVDTRVDEAAERISDISNKFSDNNINRDFVEPLDEANKKIQEAEDGTRRITDFVEPVGNEIRKVNQELTKTIETNNKNWRDLIDNTGRVQLNFEKIGVSAGEFEKNMSAAGVKIKKEWRQQSLFPDLENTTVAVKKTGEAAEVAAEGWTKKTIATVKATAAYKTFSYVMKTLALTALVFGLAEAFIFLWKNKDKVAEYFTGITKPMKEAAKTMEKLKEALEAVNQELYPETNKSKLADAYSESIRRRIDLEEELVRLEEKYAKLPKTIYQGPMFGTTINPELLKTERQIEKAKKQLEELRVEMKKTDTALKTYSWREKQEQPLQVTSVNTGETEGTEEFVQQYIPNVLTNQQREDYLKSLDEFLQSRNTITFERNKELEDQMHKHYEELRKQQLEAEAKEKEFQKKRVQGIYDSVQAISDITYGLSQIYYAAAQKDDITEEQREKRLKNYRKFLIATAAIDTAVSTAKAVQAAIGAMADTPGPLWTRIAAWGSVLATGLAGVAQMVSAFNSVNISTGSSTSSVTPPNIQTPPVAYTRNLLTDEETDQLNKGTRVYVVESDITNAQNAVKATVTNATF